MKKSLSLLSCALAGFVAFSVEARAEDPIPPKPPGPTTLPAAPATTTPASPAPDAGTPQSPAGGRNRGEMFIQMLKEKIGVTDEQLGKMKPIFGQQREKMMALKDDTSLTREQKRDKFREIITGTLEEIKPILTPEQLTKLKDEMEKRRAARQQQQKTQ
jgi:Spy/CpxP family protein refolding chaperone